MKILHEFAKSEALRPSVLLALGTMIFITLAGALPSGRGLAAIGAGWAAFYLGEQFALRNTIKIKLSEKRLKQLGLGLFVVSLIALYLDFFTAGGIPLFNSALRRFLHPGWTYLAFLMVPGMLFLLVALRKEKNARLFSIGLIAFTAAMMALLGFRTEVLAALGSAVIATYYLGTFSKKELGALVLLSIVAFAGMSVLRPGSIEVTTRATLTMGALNTALDATPLFGLTHGFVEFSDAFKVLSASPIYGGRNLVSTIVGLREGASTTTTLYGPPFIDFGVLGVLVFALFGSLLGTTYKAVQKNKAAIPFHALLLTFLLLGIETGIVDGIVWTYVLSTAIALGWFTYAKR